MYLKKGSSKSTKRKKPKRTGSKTGSRAKGQTKYL